MKILLTGCSGLVGSSLTKYLLSSGKKVIGVSRNKPNNDVLDHPHFQYIECDLSCKEGYSKLPNLNPQDIVINCASQQPRKDLDIAAYYQINTIALDYLLQWMNEKNIKKLIHFSTVVFHKFSETIEEEINEMSLASPRNYYALSKYCGELVLKIQAEYSNNFNIVSIQLPSIIMENQIGGIIDTYYEHAINDENLELFSEGRYKRNLIHLDDILKAVELSLSKIDHLSGYNPIIIGSEDSWTMKQIAEYIFEQVNSNAKVIPVKTEAPVKGHWIFNLSKAKELIGFKPSSIKIGLDKYIAIKSKS